MLFLFSRWSFSFWFVGAFIGALRILGFFDGSFLLLIFTLGVFIHTGGFDFYLVEFINLMCHGFWYFEPLVKQFPYSRVIQGTLSHFPLSLFFVCFWLQCTACGIVLWPRTESVPLVVEMWSSNHWTTRGVPSLVFLWLFSFFPFFSHFSLLICSAICVIF